MLAFYLGYLKANKAGNWRLGAFSIDVLKTKPGQIPGFWSVGYFDTLRDGRTSCVMQNHRVGAMRKTRPEGLSVSK